MFYFIITAVLVLIDQLTKHIAITKLKPVGNITFVEGFMDFTFVENRGAAFGILEGQIWVFVLITIIVIVGILIAFKKMPKTKEYNLVRAICVLIAAGAIGNFIDRVARGYVVDFFEFTFISYPVFNVADIYVVVGAIALAYIMIFVIKDEPKKLETSKETNEETNED